MKERIKRAFRECKNDCISTTSAVFVNFYTVKISFFNGVTVAFEPITEAVFDELRKEGFLVREFKLCQGDMRFVMDETLK